MSTKVNIPSPPSAETMRLLIRARLFLEHASAHASSRSDIDAMIAIHGLDNTVEYMIRILAAHLDFEGVSGKSFPESELGAMAGELNRFLTEQYAQKLPYFSELKILRQTRNLVQHDAFAPQSDLARHVVIVQRFFERALALVFALQPDALQLSQIVVNPVVRDRIAEAEKARAAKYYLKAVVACRDAFDYAILVRQATSSLRLLAVPAVTRVPDGDTDTPRFYTTLSNQISSLSLGLDSFQHERFSDIMGHIPHEHSADWHGNTVMQRPWEARDADFCYTFVTDNVLRWQAKDLEPLYQLPEPSTRFDSEDRINGHKLVQESQFNCTYSRDASWLNLMVVNRETKQRLEDLAPEKTFTWESHSTDDGAPRHRDKCGCRLKHRQIRLVCHRPELWEVALEHVRVPFTYESWKYAKGKETAASPSISKGTVEEFAKLPSIDLKLAKRVVSLREAAGKIRSEDDLRKIKGITERQVWLLSQFTRP